MNGKQATEQNSAVHTSTNDLTFMRALNAAAAAIQQNTIVSRDNVFIAFKEQVTKLNLRGGIGILAPDRKTLVFSCVAFPPGPVNEVLRSIAAKIGLKLEGYSILYNSVDIYRDIIENRRSVFIRESSSIIKQVAPVTALPFISQLITLISSTPGIFAPLIGKDNVIGLISIQGNNLHESNVEEITAFANHLAAALENSALIECLIQSEEKFRMLTEQSITGICLIQDGKFVYVNPRLAEILGFRKADMLGLTVLDLVAVQDRALVTENIRKRMSGEITYSHYTFHALRKDGLEVLMEVHGNIMQFLGRPAIMGTLLDITEQKKAETKLQNMQKLESLGVLAGGIAHDFNNLLAGIFGFIDLARSVSKDEQAKEYLEATHGSLNRARALTMQLLTFAKGGAPAQKITSIIPFIQETVNFALTGSNIACRFSLPESLWLCKIDKNQIGQVIDNIVINAKQAMPNGGTIEIAAKNGSLCEKEHPMLAKGEYVKVSIKDSGIGIPKDIMPRIFDPFYTTKTQGHGIGLATCYSIIKRHGGAIDVVSEQGKGSTFHVYLPASTEAAPVEITAILSHKGIGTIIVMDDKEAIRNSTQKILEMMGYDVICSNGGKAALDFYVSETSAGHKITAMLFDLTIPGGMGGIETVAEVRKLDRNIPVIVLSGYSDDPVMEDPRKYGFTASLSKPFTIAELSEILNNHLKI